MPCYVGTDRRFYSLFDEDYREEEFQELWNCDEDFYKRNVRTCLHKKNMV